jgi:hypothetical protein
MQQNEDVSFENIKAKFVSCPVLQGCRTLSVLVLNKTPKSSKNKKIIIIFKLASFLRVHAVGVTCHSRNVGVKAKQ